MSGFGHPAFLIVALQSYCRPPPQSCYLGRRSQEVGLVQDKGVGHPKISWISDRSRGD